MWTARTELSKNAYITSHYASPNSIAGAIGACVSNRKNVRAEPGDKNASLDHRVDRALNSLDFLPIFCFSLTKLMNGLLYTLETLDFTIHITAVDQHFYPSFDLYLYISILYLCNTLRLSSNKTVIFLFPTAFSKTYKVAFIIA